MRVMRALNRDADNGIGDGTRYEYLYEVDAFIEKYDGDDMDLDDNKELYYMHYEPCATPDIPEHEC